MVDMVQTLQKNLGGHFVMMDVKLQQTEGFDFTVVNDFRQIGVVRDPFLMEQHLSILVLQQE